MKIFLRAPIRLALPLVALVGCAGTPDEALDCCSRVAVEQREYVPGKSTFRPPSRTTEDLGQAPALDAERRARLAAGQRQYVPGKTTFRPPSD